jgi:hypothetical protein
VVDCVISDFRIFDFGFFSRVLLNSIRQLADDIRNKVDKVLTLISFFAVKLAPVKLSQASLTVAGRMW